MKRGGRAPFKLFVLFAISLAVPALLWAIGFLPTGLIALFAFCLLIRIPWPKGLVLSASATLVIYVLFYTLLKVQLPRGLFY
ncbi:tripartite tricarboxylate transporter TctB family protein [Synergistaceae bacterium OttesenSCG-928-I11]|nr:tripartite tricarboxylate transporter TctB family protein [Synergistaceae bacterium OttesenSCG-928-I11]